MACVNQTRIFRAQIPAVDRANRPRTHWPRALVQTCIDLLRWRRGCHDLLKLDDRMLADVGIRRAEAERQAREWFERWLRRRGDEGI